MVEILVNNTSIPVPAIIQKIRTGIFTTDFLGEFSYPFTVANTPDIALALNLPADLQSGADFSIPIPADLYVRSNRKYKGYLDILEADDISVKLVFVLTSGFFIQANADLSLPACYPDNDIITLDPAYDTIQGYRITCAHGDARLTINSNVLYLEKDDYEDQVEQLYAIMDWIEALDIGLIVSIVISEEGHRSSSYINYWETDTSTTAELVQMPNEGVNRSYIATVKTGKLFLMDDYNTPDDSNRIAFPMIYNPNLYEGTNSIFDGVVNRYDYAGRLNTYNPSYYNFSEAILWQNTIIPMVYLTDIVKAVFKHLNIQVSGEFFDHPMIKKLIVYNNHPIDYLDVRQGGASIRRSRNNVDSGDLDPDQTMLIYQNVFDFNIKLNNHVPDINVLEFLKAIKNYFFLKYDFNVIQNKVEIRFIRSIIRSRDILDLTGKIAKGFSKVYGKDSGFNFSYATFDPVLEKGQETIPDPDFTVDDYSTLIALDADIGQYAYVRSLSSTFRLEKQREEEVGWELYALDLQNDVEVKQSIDWELSMTPLADAYFEGWKLPAIEMPAYCPEANIFNKETGLRFTCFHGIKQDNDDRSYAFASANKYDPKSVLSEDQYDLKIRSEDLKPFYQDLQNMMSKSHKITRNVLLTEADQYTLTRTRLIRDGNIIYMIDEIEIALTDQEKTVAKMTLYKLKT
ncbi:hypothetical protein [Cyclobacterium marinum]|uniref:Uncharacterized protein n=1 Tax=Cyclobacterium marinum (strain ATCC 25205 / DSM 745 / LMG 13164 / NCIMB 1802) TaxID=880070 RepID=G0J1Z4_CYCMS|nr:hypothetical protein [Cyclobacterium marinum]AEL24000.1 hypothetical protein Cycma_0218 [Cyclobacterium marinum DSM 745]